MCKVLEIGKFEAIVDAIVSFYTVCEYMITIGVTLKDFHHRY